jgi:GNAT superfamily N-acetyltransferase
MPGIRKAGLPDLATVVELMVQLFHESAFRDFPLNIAKGTGFLRNVLTQPSQVCFLHETEAGKVDGLALGFITEPYFSDRRIAYDIALYLVPEARGSIAARRLYRALRDWAREQGALQLWLGTSAGIDPERGRRFYTGLGAEPIGGIFRVRL